LLRGDGTSLYVTQDINMANLRHTEYDFDEMYYIVGNEQLYHFQVLFELFKMLDWPFAEKCRHFSYGMIELPDGKMKSREGNVVDTDNLIDDVILLARDAVNERYDDLDEAQINYRAEVIGMGAIKFFFLKYDPLKNFVFDPQASLSFEGETGPYVQYTYARISSIKRKSEAKNPTFASYGDDEVSIVKILKEYQSVVEKSALDMKPSMLCHYLLKLCQQFNTYYSKHKVIQDDKQIEADRIALLSAIQVVIKNGLSLLGIETLEQM
jgi:arginyl-tRNA synthetase